MRVVTAIALAACFLGGGCSRPSKVSYTFALPSAIGLEAKTAITFKGIQVGYLVDLRLAPPTSNSLAAVFGTGHITDAQMQLLAGDTARIVTVNFLAHTQIEIVRNSPSGSPLPPGSTVSVSQAPSALSLLPDLLDVVAKFRQLPPDKQKQVSQQIRTIVEAAKAASTTNTP